MPYLAHFGLKDHPFTLTPNIDYYYPTQETANIVASLEFALRRDTGILKIVGEVGTGKTLLCRLLINKLVDTDTVAYINAPQADAKTILRSVCEEFGIEPATDEVSPYAVLNRFLVEEHAKGKVAVVVVDEAQHLGKEGLEAIRLLSNLETAKSKLLQVVMFGQTELDDLLRDPALRQLNQRVVFAFETKPLTVEEAKRYIVHRLRVSRREGVEYDIFADAALTAIAKRSGGIPRVVNILSDKSLLVAYSDGSPTVQKAHALAAIKDTPGLTIGGGLDVFDGSRLKVLGVTAAVLVGLLVLGVGGYFAWKGVHLSAAEQMKVETPPPAIAPAPAVAATPAETPAPRPQEVPAPAVVEPPSPPPPAGIPPTPPAEVPPSQPAEVPPSPPAEVPVPPPAASVAVAAPPVPTAAPAETPTPVRPVAIKKPPHHVRHPVKHTVKRQTQATVDPGSPPIAPIDPSAIPGPSTGLSP